MKQTQAPDSPHASETGHGAGGGDILAIGFGTTVAMWAIGYICRFPPAVVPVPVLLSLMLACAFVGGFFAGRFTRRGWTGGLQAGLVSSALNLLILGSAVGGSRPTDVSRTGMLWIPAILVAITVLSAAGATAGATTRRLESRDLNWTSAFASVAATATLMLIAIGGVVTSTREGLAVPDWPNSFGYNMFLYPLARMTGGIYFEHAHRLLGSLVGLTTLTLAVHIWRTDRTAALRTLGVLAVVAVCIQGILGGLRVTGRFTMSAESGHLAPSLTLAVIHGVFGQVFFAMLVAIAVLTSTAWRSRRDATRTPAASTDRFLGVVLVALLIVQLVVGAMQRHFEWGLLTHITLAVIVTLCCVACGARAWGLHGHQPVLRFAGRSLLILIAVQVLLGILALVAIAFSPPTTIPLPQGSPAAVDVIITTAHQVVGAILLACATLLMLGTYRFLSLEARPSTREVAGA